MISLFNIASGLINAGGGVSYDAAQTETIKQWSDPFHFIVYLFVLFVGMIIYYEWKWSKEALNNVLLEVVKGDGHASYELVPIEGSAVTLTNPKTGKVKVWPMNELSTITVPYPGVAFIPEFLQKEIRKVGVTEEDWEPYTNRSPHRKNVVSPDVLERLQAIASKIDLDNPDLTEEERSKLTAKLDEIDLVIADIQENASTYPTRELVGSPAVLGNLMHERLTEIIAALGAGLMSKLDDVLKQLTRLGKPINAMAVYIMLGVCVIAGIAGIWLSVSGSGSGDDIRRLKLIEQSLGIMDPVDNPPVQHTITQTPIAK